MFKVLLFVAAIWVLLMLFRQRKPGKTPQAEKTEDMVSCAVCGIHLPKSEAIFSQNQHFCCEAHFMQRQQ